MRRQKKAAPHKQRWRKSLQIILIKKKRIIFYNFDVCGCAARVWVRKTLISFRCLHQLNQPHVAHLDDSAAILHWKSSFSRQVVANRNLVWSSSSSGDFLRIRFVLQDCVLSNFLHSETQVNVHFRDGLPTVSCGVSYSVSYPWSAFPFCNLSRCCSPLHCE